MQSIRKIDRQGFTLIEIVIAVAIVAIFAAAMSPMVFRHLEDAKVSKGQNETDVIASAVLGYYKDVGQWPITSANGPTGNGPSAASGASNWGGWGTSKQLGDFLYFNNPDDDSSATGNGANQDSQDWPITGKGAWRGPYIDSYSLNDPWGHAYIINAYYFPGAYNGSVRHKVFVLSAGPNGTWETGFDSNQSEEIEGDDIGTLITIVN